VGRQPGGRPRSSGTGGGHDEREQTLNQLLVEMDGFDANTNVILIAATNRPDVLDPALLRPGRFDRQVSVEAPDMAGRAAILKVHAKGKPLNDDVDLDLVAKRTPGFTGADLANVLNEAALLTARSNAHLIDNRALDEAIDRVIAGPQKRTRVMRDHEKRVTAYHEAGHALATDPYLIIFTLAVAGLGLYGLTRVRNLRGFWFTLLGIGLIVLGGAHHVTGFLDGTGVALRNIHKFDPLVRLPLLVGFAQLWQLFPAPNPRADSTGSASARFGVAVAVLMWDRPKKPAEAST